MNGENLIVSAIAITITITRKRKRKRERERSYPSMVRDPKGYPLPGMGCFHSDFWIKESIEPWIAISRPNSVLMNLALGFLPTLTRSKRSASQQVPTVG
jgi:hypothetical protein